MEQENNRAPDVSTTMEPEQRPAEGEGNSRDNRPPETAPAGRKLPAAGFGIVVDDGLVTEPIRNTHGEQIGEFRFRPTDFGIIQRYNDFCRKFPDIIRPLEKISIRQDGTADTDTGDYETGAAVLEEAQTRLYAACNDLFGGNFAEAFFGRMNPFSPVGGRLYCENALEAVGAFISKRFQQETDQLHARLANPEDPVGKYTRGYLPPAGKHSGGRKRKRRKRGGGR